MPITTRKIRDIATDILEEAGIDSPAVPVDLLIRRLGIQIARKNLDDETSGFVYFDSKTDATVIGLNVSHSRTRQRFTLAHELGHYLLHKDTGGHLHVDDEDFFIRFRDKTINHGPDRQENEANAFAAELLMPRSFLERDLKQLKYGVSISDEKAIRSMANRFGVSLQALLFRLGNLHLLERSLSL